MAFGLGPTVFDVINLIVCICKNFAVANATVLEFRAIQHIVVAQVIGQDNGNQYEQFLYTLRNRLLAWRILLMYIRLPFENTNGLAFDCGTSPLFCTTEPTEI